MRRKIAAGNWKMNLDLDGARALSTALVSRYGETNGEAEVILAPPAVFLQTVAEAVKDHPQFAVAAQNVHQEESGAFTGEISASMLKSIGVEYAIVGHSERRQIFGEDNALLLAKIRACLDQGLRVVYCIGETLDEREMDKTFEVLSTQLQEVVFQLDGQELTRLVLAYEPVWAIGTGKTASPEQAQEVHAFLRHKLAQFYDQDSSQHVPILYGGSVKPDNATLLFACPDIDGGLVGGASLKADDFLEIMDSFF